MNPLPFTKRISNVFSDLLLMTERNVIRYTRVPQLLVFSSIQPVMFLLLFTYVFGGAIQHSAGNYINYLLPGIFVQTALFGSIQTGVGLTEDLAKGLIDRFRSLPIARGAVLAGRTISDMLRNIFVLFIMTIVGYIIGFRFENGWGNALAAYGLILFFGFAFSWISATIGLLVKNIETAQVVGFIWVFPLVFASSVFVPIATMPHWLQNFAKINPITSTVNTVRALTVGGTLTPYVGQSILWIIGILVVFIPLAISLYRRTV